MALTRNYLKSLSLTGEQVEGVISAHAQTVDGLKSQIERYRSDAAALPDIQKELDDARQELLLLHADPWEERFHAVSAEFESFKQQISDRELIQAKESAYRELLREVGVNERRIDAVMRVSDMECVQWEDGRIVNEAQLREKIAYMKYNSSENKETVNDIIKEMDEYRENIAKVIVNTRVKENM